DEVRVYNRALSAEEVALLYSNQTNITHYIATSARQNWTVSVTPIDEHGLNGSSVMSNGILLNLNNTWVCNDTSICRYGNITDALYNLNNTGSTIFLIQGNYTYTVETPGSFNISMSGAVPTINITASNITLDCNGSLLNGPSTGSGYGVYSSNFDNLTIRNCHTYNYSVGFRILYSNNSLLENNSAGHGNYGLAIDHFNNGTIQSNKFYDILIGGILSSGYIDNNDIYMNNFTSNSRAIDLLSNSSYNQIYNNTIKDNLVGIRLVCNPGFYVCDWNTLYNNTIINSTQSAISLSNADNNTIIHNLIINSTQHSISLSSPCADNNVTENSVFSTGAGYYDLNIGGGTSNKAWLNSFYSKGVSDSGIDSIFCVNSQGNFYEHNLSHSSIGNGTGLNDTNIGGDCGPSILIYPAGGESFVNKSSPIKINWTEQSSVNNISYNLFYSSNNGTSWTWINSTSDFEYNWSIYSLSYGTEYRVKVVPFDDIYNATNTSSGPFLMGLDNNWVCSDETLCEYQDITSALTGENNTVGNITIQESGLYIANSMLGFNITSVGTDFGYAIRINASDVVLDCNGSSLFSESASDSYAIYISRNESAINNITVRNCSINYYEAGIVAYNADNITLDGNTILGNFSGGSGSNSGIIFENVSGPSTIKNNVLSSFVTWGIRTLYSYDTNIYSNNISNCSSAISAYTIGSSNLNITGNWINDTQNIALSNDTLFKGNMILNNEACSSGIISISSLSNINITENTLLIQAGADCNNSVYAVSGTGINIWHNNFYSVGVNVTGSESSFCVNGIGNFYGENISISFIGNGTGESGGTIGGDCGPVNITYPIEGGSYKNNITINWTNQSSVNNISYYLYYSEDNGGSWNYLASTPSYYTWDVSAMMGTGFRLMTIPYDDYHNATHDTMSSSFTILPDNEYVCSNSSYCEYDNLTLALIGEDNSNNTIYLIEPNSTYIISNTSFNISPSGLYPAIQVNASNITIDCNGSS
ncbi:MAG: right-handed parallel beta-helix repeat-containing protein, partial [Nanoarchaeota archaeon]|nr:right-handed parallel beta-helix repeat-containing protein [Nanoarchaeota archaeon]